MSIQLKFIAALGATFPILSDTMVRKCWDSVKHLPEPALDALYGGLLVGGIAAIELRKSLACAITAAIGTEVRR